MLMKMLGDMSDKLAECCAGMLAISRDVSSLQVAEQCAPEPTTRSPMPDQCTGDA